MVVSPLTKVTGTIKTVKPVEIPAFGMVHIQVTGREFMYL